MSSTCSDPRRYAAILCALAAGCALQEPPRHVRPALPLPARVAERYALDGEVIEQTFVPIGGEDGLDFFRGRVVSGSEIARFYYLRPSGQKARGDGAAKTPFVLCLPILAGGQGLMWFIARHVAARGYSVGWTERVASAMRPPQRGPELETLFRRTVIHNRMMLAWARQQPEIDSDRLGLLGVSLGGFVANALLAVEPDVCAGAICLAGADVPDIIMKSTEGRVVSWRDWRRDADTIADSELLRELGNDLVSDPAFLGGYVDTHKVLLIATALDEVVPMRNQDLLWESLGRPRRIVLPLAHYSAALGAGAMLGSAEEFLGDRFARAGRVASPSPAH